jgi:hypothetical protein
VTATYTKRDWTPVLNGESYCSPACGYPCTKAMHDAALEKAAKLAATLGPGWKADVWENLGWHYRAISACGRIKVHAAEWAGCRTTYTAFVGEPGSGGGRWAEHGDTPAKAVANAIAKAKTERDALVAALEGL